MSIINVAILAKLFFGSKVLTLSTSYQPNTTQPYQLIKLCAKAAANSQRPDDNLTGDSLIAESSGLPVD